MTEENRDLKGAVAVLTGAAQGLGRAIAHDYAREGMRIALIDVKADKLAEVAAEVRNLGGSCITITADLADAGQTQAAIDQALKEYGTPRILVHNAALLKVRPFKDLTFEQWTRENAIITQAAFILTKAVWQGMLDAKSGSIVYISSGSGIKGFLGESAYCTGKHGQEGLMKCLALEGEPFNIAVNTVTPGAPINTPMSDENYTPAQKLTWVDPSILAPAFVYLARADASIVTGQRLNAFELAQSVMRSETDSES